MAEAAHGPTEAGAVVLEIGGRIGALVLRVPDSLAGCEIEISPAAEPARRTHALVRPRHVAGGISHAAIYERLPPGEYTVWREAGRPAAAVTVAAGRVTSFDWPSGLPSRP
jgi:hypothetical protein